MSLTTPDEAVPRSRPLAGAAPWLVLGLAMLAAALWQFPGPRDGNGDTAWLLIVAGRWLDGATLYVDLFETNPPMSMLLYVPPVWLARQIGLAPELVTYAAVTVLAGVALAVGWRLAPALGHGQERERVLLVAALAFLMLVLPTRCFAQREHIAAIALMPYWLVLALRWQGAARPGAGLIVLAGLGAGLALSIKPHFGAAIALAHAALLGSALWRAGSVRAALVALRVAVLAGRVATPEAALALALFGLYLGCVLIWFPAFFEVIYPRVALVYLPHRLTLFEFATAPATIMGLGALVLIALSRPTRPGPLALVLLGATAGALAAYSIQAKGWAYHQLPTAVFAGLCFTVLVLESVRREVGALSRLAPALVGMAALYGALLPGLFARHTTPRALEAEIRRHGPAPRLLIASSNLGLSFPLVRRLDGEWVGRSASLWMSEGASALAASTADPAHHASLVDIFALDRRLFVEDALAARPDVIGLSALDPDSDLLPWALAEPRMAKLLESYREVAIADGVRVFVRLDRLSGPR